MGPVIQKEIRRDHPAMAGHFPGNPIVPGVVLLTELVGIIESETRWKGGSITVTSMKFMRLLRPGEFFTLRWQLITEQDINVVVARAGETIAAGTLRWTDSATRQAGS